jgi:hypothetical protein
MSINEKLLNLFQVARTVNSRLWWEIDKAESILSVTRLQGYITEHHKLSIEFYTVDEESHFVLGHLERSGQGGQIVRIYTLANLSPRWIRFVKIKELCQLLLDTAADMSTNAQDTLQRIVSDLVEVDAPENAIVLSEFLAEFLAIELVYELDQTRKDFAEIVDREAAISKIAKRLSIPEDIVDHCLNPASIAWREKWWKLVADRFPEPEL